MATDTTYTKAEQTQTESQTRTEPPPSQPPVTGPGVDKRAWRKVFDPEGIADILRSEVPGAVSAVDQFGITLRRDKLLDALKYLKDTPELRYDYLHQVTSVDWVDRFEVDYHLTSIARGGPPLPLRVNLPADVEHPTIPSATGLYASADQQEREVYDLMGIVFLGHPNLRRIFMWEGFLGHPLRKSYKEPYYEQEHKPFDTRWDQGHHVIAEDRTPWHDNVRYPLNFDATHWQPPPEIVRVVPTLTEGESGPALRTQPLVVNIGPQHPSTHGVFRLRVTVEGETIMAVEPIYGYMHRNHEKIGERNTWIMNFPYCDRLDYLSGMAMEHGYALAVEQLLGVKPPERAEYIRVIMDELTRIESHLFGGIGQLYSDLGAFFTPILYGIEERELIVDIFEAASGSRMMPNYIRFGGVWRDLPEGTLEVVQEIAENRMPRVADELESYLVHNEIFNERARNVGVLSAETAINYGVSGPMLRASGVKYDVRRADPYSIYDRFDFDIPVGNHGDIYDRLAVRIQELRESCKILRQAVRDIPNGAVQNGRKNYQQRVPPGSAYGHLEAPRGEFGWYVVSNGGANPYRYHVRAADFVNLATLGEMGVGYKIGDLIAALGSVDIIMGSVDR